MNYKQTKCRKKKSNLFLEKKNELPYFQVIKQHKKSCPQYFMNTPVKNWGQMLIA